MVSIGNFQIKTMNTQNKSAFIFDTYTDIWSLKNNYALRKLTSPNVKVILQQFNLEGFSWDYEYIISRFDLAEANATKADYLVFLMQEETIHPDRMATWVGAWGSAFSKIKNKQGWNTGKDYVIEGIKIHWGGSSQAFYIQLLRAWKSLCDRLKKKAAFISAGCPGTPPNQFNGLFGSDIMNYLCGSYDMIYAYRYPQNPNQAKWGVNDVRYLKEMIAKNNGHALINYILTFNRNEDIARTEYQAVVNAGADIISCYPGIGMPGGTNKDGSAATRLIKLYNEFYKPPVLKWKCGGQELNYSCFLHTNGKYETKEECELKCKPSGVQYSIQNLTVINGKTNIIISEVK